MQSNLDSELDFSETSSSTIKSNQLTTPSIIYALFVKLESSDRSDIMYNRYKKQKVL